MRFASLHESTFLSSGSTPEFIRKTKALDRRRGGVKKTETLVFTGELDEENDYCCLVDSIGNGIGSCCQ
ncbi:hypothetical protein, partial [Sutterella wadsworthensis]|uniref:hypothetical protein n=1 Tax=Sutterella wadsworthensis TaxID=40545 RepID=UPI00396743F7